MSINQSTTNLGSVNALSVFETLACSVWSWLGNARRLRLGFSEDTVSDLTELEIARLLSRSVDVRRVTRREERITGFDWMWIFHQAGSIQAAYVVQAKKMKLEQSASYSYSSLRYRAGSRFQIEALEDFAGRVGAKPLYCFYNNVDSQTARSHWHCRTEQSPDESQLGCTLAPLHKVKLIHCDRGSRKNFQSLHRKGYALPWRCLFHPRCASDLAFDHGIDGSSFANTGVSRMFDRILKPGSDDEALIDVDKIIEELKTAELMDHYAHGRFVPVPERIAVFDTRDDWKINQTDSNPIA